MPDYICGSKCTVQLRNGEFCDDPADPDAPYPICARHGMRLYQYVAGKMSDLVRDPKVVAAIKQPIRNRERQHALPRSVVYYVQINEHIKIGRTKNLHQRLARYPLNRRLLAYEIETEGLERARHLQFRHLRDMGKEWFRPGPDLLVHINALRVKMKAPPIVALLPNAI